MTSTLGKIQANQDRTQIDTSTSKFGTSSLFGQDNVVDRESTQAYQSVSKNSQALHNQIKKVIEESNASLKSYPDVLSQLTSLSQSTQTLQESQNVTFSNEILYPVKDRATPLPVSHPNFILDPSVLLNTMLRPSQEQILAGDEIAQGRPKIEEVNKIIRSILQGDDQNDMNRSQLDQVSSSNNNDLKRKEVSDAELTSQELNKINKVIEQKVQNTINPKIETMLEILNHNMIDMRRVKNLRGKDQVTTQQVFNSDQNEQVLSTMEIDIMEVQFDETQLVQVSDYIIDMMMRGNGMLNGLGSGVQAM
eukprot:403372244